MSLIGRKGIKNLEWLLKARLRYFFELDSSHLSLTQWSYVTVSNNTSLLFASTCHLVSVNVLITTSTTLHRSEQFQFLYRVTIRISFSNFSGLLIFGFKIRFALAVECEETAFRAYKFWNGVLHFPTALFPAPFPFCAYFTGRINSLILRVLAIVGQFFIVGVIGTACRSQACLFFRT
jgi:hypothetical protein